MRDREASDLAEIKSSLTAALLSDTLDSLGYTNQALPGRIRPLDETLVMVGRARTALYMDVYDAPSGENPYQLQIDLIDSLLADEIPVFSCGGTGRIGPWGELLSTAAGLRGAAGAVMDGAVRDILAIRAMGFPVFHAGVGLPDSKGRGKVMAIDIPVHCAGVLVRTGDLMFGDADGVVVVPRHIEAEVIGSALEKLKGEQGTVADLRAGISLRDVFEKYGIL